MNCVSPERLDLYADGELPPHELGELQEHLQTCSTCAAEALSRMQMKRSVRAAATDAFVPSPHFRAQLRNSILPTRKSRAGWWPAVSFAAATIAAVVITAFLFLHRTADRDVFAEAADAHVAILASANPVDVVSTDRHTVKPWFQGKLPFTFNLPELQNSEFRLIGGRVGYIAQQPAAHLLFAIRKHELSVFILQDSEKLAGLGRNSARQLNFNANTWSQEGLRYVVLSDAAMSDVEALSHLLQTSSQ